MSDIPFKVRVKNNEIPNVFDYLIEKTGSEDEAKEAFDVLSAEIQAHSESKGVRLNQYADGYLGVDLDELKLYPEEGQTNTYLPPLSVTLDDFSGLENIKFTITFDNPLPQGARRRRRRKTVRKSKAKKARRTTRK